VNPEGVGHIDAYLLVAADPFSEDFSEIASALEPLRARKDLMLALFPQGEQSSNKAIVERCKQVGWTDPFLVVRYAPGFTASYFDDDLEPPSLLLQSPEGRVIHASRWVEDAPAMLARRIDEELGQAPTRATPAVRAGGRLEDPLS
jgi:hypothetical protein